MENEVLNGADYRATVRLSNAADDTLAAAGATCENVPAVSLAPLLASGKIEKIVVDRRATKVEPVTNG